jgi:hypothetical protein
MRRDSSNVEVIGSMALSDRSTTDPNDLAHASTLLSATVLASRSRLAISARHCRELKPLSNEEYYGGDRGEEEVPVRERLAGAITRNHYGCLVLNANRALFIDVDVLPAGRANCPVEPWQQVLGDLCTVLSNERDEGFRMYRTAAGYRIIATRREYEPMSPESAALMESVGADVDFVSLCRVQNSFRARLTPKPWRCGVRRPPNFFPRESVQQKLRFAEWLSGYEQACRGHATCRYLGHVGPEKIHECITPIVELHDRETKAHGPLPLA